ncbi:SDR family NAD(P)-dependent oxidoreductase [Loktanella sp. IMCC34160]|uniref:SDR family NAD(P)-dependent oxidoreductase n=1 Tax=Loktanella sp. IMCC34160 TaxID=2510646 RepID=UPI00101C054F|nr:SDR family NAD(P)-dependent oxidoreductase [Loktanella sp. IMCC34160]RYG90544.1 SDR family NAD(P)-dependent oxidoreductase [Loktanella sp. IMCC34160]
MKRALVIGSSGGIGAALCQHLRGQGAEVLGLSRSEHGLDLRNPPSIDAAMGTLSGVFDTVFVATGVLTTAEASPEKSLSAIDADQMAQVFAVNAIGPALLLKALPRLLPKDRPCRVGVLSARVGSIGDNRIGGWHSYRASKAALNQIIRGASIELRRTHRQSVCVALHPGTVATPFTAHYAGRHKTVTADTAAANLVAVLDALSPDQTGGFFDYAGAPVDW